MSTRYREKRGREIERETSTQSKASQGDGKARLAVSCLALPGGKQRQRYGKQGHVMTRLARGVSPLYRKNKETHLICSEKERGHGMGRGKARAGARQPKAEQGKRYSM